MQPTLLEAILQSGPIAQAVFLILLLFSILVWALLFVKQREIEKTRKQHKVFLEFLNKHLVWDKLVKESLDLPPSGSKSVLDQARKTIDQFNETYSDLKVESLHPQTRRELLTLLERAMEACILDQEKRLNQGQVVLATVSVVAPFVGLFGTVVGIIDAFQRIAILKSVDLSVVAPGIAEALVATAGGLFTAIPATIGFNIFRSRIRELVDSMEQVSLIVMNRFQLAYMALNEKKK